MSLTEGLMAVSSSQMRSEVQKLVARSQLLDQKHKAEWGYTRRYQDVFIPEDTP